MADQKINFNDGASYELMMGKWSQLVGEIFLDWLDIPAGLQWIDIGCGNGAFTQLIVDRCNPAEVRGIDPSPGQLDFARQRPAAQVARFLIGDSMCLPFCEHRFDAAVMALVIFFVPEPAKGVAEMVRVVRPGGYVTAYAWDIIGDGFPLAPIQAEMLQFGLLPLRPPRPETSEIGALGDLWTAAGLANVDTREITVRRKFASFDEFWEIGLTGASIGEQIATLPSDDAQVLKKRVQARMLADSDGSVSYSARAHAVIGRVQK